MRSFKQLPTFAFILLLFFFIPSNLEFASSVVPGWHTTIFPPYTISNFTILFIIIVNVIVYYLLGKKKVQLNTLLVVAHFLVSLATVALMQSPELFLFEGNYDIEIITNRAIRIEEARKYLLFSLIVIEIPFLYWCLKTAKRSKNLKLKDPN